MRITEKLIFRAFVEMLEEQPLHKITVTGIVRRCEINRNTFYYHFRDIPDLIERLAETQTRQILSDRRRFRRPLTFLFYLMLLAVKYKKVLLNLYHSEMQAVLDRQIEVICHFYAHRYITEIRNMPGHSPLSAKDTELLIRYWRTLTNGIFLDWLRHDMEYDLLHAVKRLCVLVAAKRLPAPDMAVQRRK
ncbi:MAG: TetR/AcrR family transcriptional regulator C-terminal domain-containing protein [Succiniclasticum sp.]|jgi:AcrR family transcriptional regulator